MLLETIFGPLIGPTITLNTIKGLTKVMKLNYILFGIGFALVIAEYPCP